VAWHPLQGGYLQPHVLPGTIRDRRDVTLPATANHAFWLDGSACEYPDFENADTFMSRLVRKGIIARDSSVDTVLRRQPDVLSLRSMQRHFLQATGMTRSAVRQIERARYATNLLREGVSILDTVHEARYYDQAHLTKSLKYLIGQTPVEIVRGAQQLSFYTKRRPFHDPIMRMGR
jgi:hypothetical protein